MYSEIKVKATSTEEAVTFDDLKQIRGISKQCFSSMLCEIEAGKLADQFPVDVMQGGAGTSSNMNMNEVIANRALEIAGRQRGDYNIHPSERRRQQVAVHERHLPGRLQTRGLSTRLGRLCRVHQETRRLPRSGGAVT